MSDVRRIRIQTGPLLDDDGHVWPALPVMVLASDYDALKARCEALTKFAEYVRDNTRDGAASYSGISLHALACSALADGEEHGTR